MKISVYVKKNIICFFRESKIAIICFIIFPMVMAYIYGIMQNHLFTGENSFKPIDVEFKYDKSSENGKIISSVLKNKSVKTFINTDIYDKPKCIVSIDNNFENIKIENKGSSNNEIDIVKGFMQTFSESINQYTTVVDNVSKLKINSEQKKQLTNNLIIKMSQVNKTSSIKQKILPSYRWINAREYYTISMFSFTSIIFIITLVKEFYGDRKQGVIKRSFSTPSTKQGYFAGCLVSYFILTFVVNFIYLVINKALGIAFVDSFSWNVVLALLQSILQAAVVGIFITFVKSEQVANSILAVLLILPATIGGVFFSSDVTGVKVLKALSGFAPNSLILNSYKDLAITGKISGVTNQILIILILSLVLIVIGTLKAKVSWEE